MLLSQRICILDPSGNAVSPEPVIQKMQKRRTGAGYFCQFALVQHVVMVQSSVCALAIITLLFLFGCGGNLTDEQRRQMREKMEMNKVIRVTDLEITEGALSKGRSLIGTLENFQPDSSKVDAFLKNEGGRIRFIRPGNSDVQGLERQLLEAYAVDGSGSLQDNVQPKRDAQGEYDSLLYTKPVTKKTAGGSEQLVGVWSIWLRKKEVILELTRKK